MKKDVRSLSHRVVYSSWDFQQALSALTFLMEEREHALQCSPIEWRRLRCFETTAIVSFSRPFKVGRGRKPLDLKEVGFQISKDEEKLKDKIIFLRDKVVSHSDEEDMEYLSASVKPFDDLDIRIPVERFSEALYLTETECQEFEIFLRRLLKAIAIYKFHFAQSNPGSFKKLKNSSEER